MTENTTIPAVLEMHAVRLTTLLVTAENIGDVAGFIKTAYPDVAHLSTADEVIRWEHRDEVAVAFAGDHLVFGATGPLVFEPGTLAELIPTLGGAASD